MWLLKKKRENFKCKTQIDHLCTNKIYFFIDYGNDYDDLWAIGNGFGYRY